MPDAAAEYTERISATDPRAEKLIGKMVCVVECGGNNPSHVGVIGIFNQDEGGFSVAAFEGCICPKVVAARPSDLGEAEPGEIPFPGTRAYIEAQAQKREWLPKHGEPVVCNGETLFFCSAASPEKNFNLARNGMLITVPIDWCKPAPPEIEINDIAHSVQMSGPPMFTVLAINEDRVSGAYATTDGGIAKVSNVPRKDLALVHKCRGWDEVTL